MSGQERAALQALARVLDAFAYSDYLPEPMGVYTNILNEFLDVCRAAAQEAHRTSGEEAPWFPAGWADESATLGGAAPERGPMPGPWSGGLLPEGLATAAHRWEELVEGVGEAEFSSTDYPDGEHHQRWLGALRQGGTPPKGFVWLKDAEVDAIALVPAEAADAWEALLNHDLRKALQQAWLTDGIRPEGGVQGLLKATRRPETAHLDIREWTASVTCRQAGRGSRLEVVIASGDPGAPFYELTLTSSAHVGLVEGLEHALRLVHGSGPSRGRQESAPPSGRHDHDRDDEA